MIGIMKAGGAFVPLDPTHPRNRRQAVLSQIGSSFMLVSPQTASLCTGMAEKLIEVCHSLDANLSDESPVYSGVGPGNVAYVLFTSGSTGTPKGIVMAQRR